MRTTVRGHAVHSSRVDIGVPAVMVAGKLIAWHDDVMQENKASADARNPFEPPYSTLHVGVVEGGTAVNITAEHCTFSHEVRVVPGDGADYVGRYRARIAELEGPMKAIAPETGITLEITSQTRRWRRKRTASPRRCPGASPATMPAMSSPTAPRAACSRPRGGRPWSAGPAISPRRISRTSSSRWRNSMPAPPSYGR